ncbi:hypothetical protein N7488_012358 [Penicillium malachiteum]|nr:hypothetical protein N7488_012358 [Penicillium malachiteum]
MSSVAFNDHAKVSKPVFLGIIWTSTALSIIFLAFRIKMKLSVSHRLFIDDGLALLAGIIMLAYAIIWQIKGQVLYELYAVGSGKAEMTVEFIAQYNIFMRYIAPSTILFYSCLWAIKFSFLAFFLQLGSKAKSHRIWWYIVLAVTLGVYIACVADVDYRCSLSGLEYIMEHCGTQSRIHFSNRTFWANCAGDIVTDILILSVPYVILRKTQIPFRKKIILLSIFSATIVVMVVALVRVVINSSLNKNRDISWLYFWSGVEMGVAIIISCTASFRQLFINSKNQHMFNEKAQNSYSSPLISWNNKSKAKVSYESTGTVNTDYEEGCEILRPMEMVRVRS